MGEILLQQGDICQQKVEAIVNAANSDLLHGGGLAAAIAAAGGNIIQEQSNKVGPIPVGEAAVTSGGKLKAKYVIHAASMKLGEPTIEENLVKSIQHSFQRAYELGVKSIAFPAIGTGIGGFPVEQCAKISLKAAQQFIAKYPEFKRVIFVLHNNNDLQIFNKVYQKMNLSQQGKK